MRHGWLSLALAGFALSLGLVGAGQALAAPDRSDEVLVRTNDGASPAERAQVAERLGAVSSRRLLAGWSAYELPRAVSEQALDARLGPLEQVSESAVDRPVVRPMGIPNDPYWAYQWDMLRIGAPAAWDQPQGQGVLVAVTDTGIDVSHPDLAPVIWRNTREVPGDGIDNDANGYVDDYTGWNAAARNGQVFAGSEDTHGTHVAGTIAATRGNGVGVAGIASNARILPVKFITGGAGSHADAIAAIRYAIASGARVINASWGTTTPSAGSAVCDAIAEATRAGILFVAAAGNESTDLDQVTLIPAACEVPGMITVASSGATDLLSSFSNRGARTVELSAPGENIASTIPGAIYGSSSGTSMAAPHVSGAAALLLGRNPSLRPARLAALIANSTDPIAAQAGLTRTGGRLNITRALSWAISPPADSTPPEPFSLIGASASSTPVFRWTRAWDAGVGVSEYRLVVDGRVVVSVPGEQTSAQVPTALGTGQHSWRVDALDAAGNLRSSQTQALNTDQIVPAAFTLNAPRYVHRNDWSISWSASSDESGLDRYEVLIEGVLVKEVPADRERVFRCADPYGCLYNPAGSLVEVRAVDGVGNRRSVSVTLSRSAAPRGVLSGPALSADPSPTIRWQPVGISAAVDHYDLLIDSRLVGTVGTAAREITVPAPLASGAHQVQLRTIASDGTVASSDLSLLISGPAMPPAPWNPDPGQIPDELTPPAGDGTKRLLTPADPLQSPVSGLRRPGTLYVSKPTSPVSLRIPHGATLVAITTTKKVPSSAWTSARERLLLSVPAHKASVRLWVSFSDGDRVSDPRPVTVVLDRTRPVASVRRAGSQLRLVARDRGGVVSSYQLRTGGRLSAWRAYRTSLALEPGQQVRVRDQAGNLSPFALGR